ncbi:MAG TPA: bifunctional diguanylate cyclase/phosphodiesterase [Steroidobacteraceae bacterium]
MGAVAAAAWLALRLRRLQAQRALPAPGSPNRHDALTGLPTRVAIVATAEQAIAEAQRAGATFAVTVLNVSRFKSINDALGHEVGDEVLRALSRRLAGLLATGDVLGRLAGDEFIVLARVGTGAVPAEVTVETIFAALREPFSIEGHDIEVAVSAGISMFPQDGATFDLLLRRGETAMRAARSVARGTFRFYCEEMSRSEEERVALEADLRGAIREGQFELHYQPKVDIASGRVRSAEALLRWRHPRRGLVPPNVFIPIAEEAGLILPIGEWVLRQACAQMRAWLDAGLPPLRVSVNLSARQFRHGDLTAVVCSALEDAQLQPGYLELELTESSIMHDPESSAATLQLLSTMGVHISIDDFGTGYSSLSYLWRLPLDKLKIDRSFVRELLSNPDDVAIVKAIISLAHSLRLGVVAEGVETLEQLEHLRELGCDQYQGFYCSPAVPADAFVALIKRLRAEKPALTEADMLRTQSRLYAYTPEMLG